MKEMINPTLYHKSESHYISYIHERDGFSTGFTSEIAAGYVKKLPREIIEKLFDIQTKTEDEHSTCPKVVVELKINEEVFNLINNETK